MRKITRNKRRTGSAIIQNGYYNGPRHWLLLNPPPLPGREATFSFTNSMVRALHGGYGKSSWNINPSLPVLSFCRIHTATDFARSTTLSLLLSLSRKYRCKFNIYNFMLLKDKKYSTLRMDHLQCKILIIQKYFDKISISGVKARKSVSFANL